MHLPIEIRDNILAKFQSIFRIGVEKEIMFENDLIRNFSQNDLGVLRGQCFWGSGCPNDAQTPWWLRLWTHLCGGGILPSVSQGLWCWWVWGEPWWPAEAAPSSEPRKQTNKHQTPEPTQIKQTSNRRMNCFSNSPFIVQVNLAHVSFMI